MPEHIPFDRAFGMADATTPEVAFARGAAAAPEAAAAPGGTLVPEVAPAPAPAPWVLPAPEPAPQRTAALPSAANSAAADLRSDAFLERAMRRWGDMVLRLALSQLRDASDAEDVFQDVFIRLLKDHTIFNDDEHLKAWLLRVTVNRCRDIGRSGWKRRNEPLAERHTTIEAPNLLGSEVWDAIGALPPDLRAVVHLHYVEGYSTDEVAGLVGCRPSTARTRLHRARKHMRAALETGELAGRSARSAVANDQPASPRSATNETTPSGKEADHEQRSLQRLRYEDAGGESVRPPA